MADFVDSLVDMGFDRNKAAKAVQLTGNTGVEAAMEWLFANPDAAVPSNVSSTEPKEGQEAGALASAGNTEAEVVRSYKCDDCGKQFKNETEMEFHAAKTQHSNFSESTEAKKPLTPEEKAEQLKRIDEKLKEKRAEREAREKAEAIEREKSRVKTGKDVTDAKRRFEEQQMKELVEERRRDKLDEKKARERVRAQIESDKAARKAKQDAEQGGGAAMSPPTTPLASAPASSAELPVSAKKDYTQAKIQLRLPSGKALVQTFGAQEPLAAVRLYVEINRDDGLTGPFNLMTNFPRKVFQGEDYDVPLEALGLVPSAVLMVTRAV